MSVHNRRVPRKRTVLSPDRPPPPIARRRDLVFARKGYRRAGISDIIAEAGVARGTFYLYFDSKEEIFLAIVEEFHENIRDALANATTTRRRPMREGPKRFSGRASAAGWASSRPTRDLTTVMLKEASAIDPRFEKGFADLRDLAIRLLPPACRFQEAGNRAACGVTGACRTSADRDVRRTAERVRPPGPGSRSRRAGRAAGRFRMERHSSALRDRRCQAITSITSIRSSPPSAASASGGMGSATRSVSSTRMSSCAATAIGSGCPWPTSTSCPFSSRSACSAGGRALVVFRHEWSFYRDHLALVPAVWLGGLATHGLIIGGFAGVAIFCAVRKRPFRPIFDALASSAAVHPGMRPDRQLHRRPDRRQPDNPALGRAVSGSRGHPASRSFSTTVSRTFSIIPILWMVQRRGVPQGRLASLFVLLYAGLRIPIDLLRDYPISFLFLPAGQTFNVMMAATGLAFVAKNVWRPPVAAASIGRGGVPARCSEPLRSRSRRSSCWRLLFRATRLAIFRRDTAGATPTSRTRRLSPANRRRTANG